MRKIKPIAPARAIIIPRAMMLTMQYGYSDKTLPRDTGYGHGIVGAIESASRLGPLNVPARTTMGSEKEPPDQERRRRLIAIKFRRTSPEDETTGPLGRLNPQWLALRTQACYRF